MSGFPAWLLWRTVYLSKMPTLLRKVEVAADWARSLFFPPNIVQAQLSRTMKVGRAHFAQGQYVFRKGDKGDRFYLIERGQAGVYVDELSSPVNLLQPGDHFGEVAALAGSSRAVSVRAETHLDLILLASDDLRRLADHLGVLKRDLQRTAVTQAGYESLRRLMEAAPWMLQRRVSDWTTRPPETLPLDAPLANVVNRFHNGRAGYPVVDRDGVFAGYCGRSQLYEALRSLRPPETPLREFVLADAPSVREDDRLPEVLVQLSRSYVEVLPVLATDGSRRVVGVLSPIEIFRKTMGERYALAVQ